MKSSTKNTEQTTYSDSKQVKKLTASGWHSTALIPTKLYKCTM